MNDEINSPAHYLLFPGMEAIDVIKASLTPEEFAGYLKGNALKYRLRAGGRATSRQDSHARDLLARPCLVCGGNHGGLPCPNTLAFAGPARGIDELSLHGWPQDDSPRQQRIEQGGELAEVYEVLDQIKGGNQ